MKPTTKRTLQATSLDTEQLRQASGGRGTLCGVLMHCDSCGYGWNADASGSYGAACPNCGLGVDTDAGGGGGGGGGGGDGGGDCGNLARDCMMCC